MSAGASRVRSRAGRPSTESGHMMAGLMAFIAILLVFSTVVFQAWEDVLRRDNEAEMMFRAKQLVRGLQRYRLDHGGVAPNTLEQLQEPGPLGQYYIRRLYDDPLVEDGKWGLLYQGGGGQVIDASAIPQVPQGQGLLGQALAEANGGSGQNDTSLLQTSSNPGGGLGLPLAGVKSLSEDRPFRVYNGFTNYAQWLFTVLELDRELLQTGANNPAGTLPTDPNASGINSGNPGIGGSPLNPTPNSGGGN